MINRDLVGTELRINGTGYIVTSIRFGAKGSFELRLEEILTRHRRLQR